MPSRASKTEILEETLKQMTIEPDAWKERAMRAEARVDILEHKNRVATCEIRALEETTRVLRLDTILRSAP